MCLENKCCFREEELTDLSPLSCWHSVILKTFPSLHFSGFSSHWFSPKEKYRSIKAFCHQKWCRSCCSKICQMGEKFFLPQEVRRSNEHKARCVWTCGWLYKFNVYKNHKYNKSKNGHRFSSLYNGHLCVLDFKLREEIGIGNCITSSGVWISMLLSSFISSKLLRR